MVEIADLLKQVAAQQQRMAAQQQHFDDLFEANGCTRETESNYN